MPLTYIDKGTSGTQLDVRTGSLSIGHIGKEMFTEVSGNRPPRWRWYLKLDHNALPPGCIRAGNADSLEQAKALVEQNWRAWLDAAGLKEA